MSSIEDNICSLHVPLSDKHEGYRQICTHFCRLRQNMSPWNTGLLPQYFFFLSFTVKSCFCYRPSTSERIWHRIWRGYEAGKDRLLLLSLCSGLSEAVKLFTEHFTFLLLNKYLAKQFAKDVSVEQGLSRSIGSQLSDPLGSLPNQHVLKFTHIFALNFLGHPHYRSFSSIKNRVTRREIGVEQEMTSSMCPEMDKASVQKRSSPK